jgi:thiosulfate dehydrogenase [quinone] large subunit
MKAIQLNEVGMNPQSRPWKEDASLAYALLRIALGLNICMHGVVRWAGGLGNYAASLVAMFHKESLPAWAVYSFGYALPVLEATVGGAVMIGLQTRRALMAGMVLMLALTFGSTLRQDWQIVGLQLIYSFLYAVLLAGTQLDEYSIDRLLAWKK